MDKNSMLANGKSGACSRLKRDVKIAYYPEWYPVNDHMTLYQRHSKPCVWTCARSCCERNSELTCVWTHLMGFLFTLQGFRLFMQKPDDDFLHPGEERFLFIIMFVGACCCLGFSTIYHVIFSHSEPYYKAALRIDLCGIVLGTNTPWYTWIYYSFYCERGIRIFLMALIAICGIAALYLLTTCSSLLQECMAKQRAMIASAVFTLTFPVYAMVFYRDGFLYALHDGCQRWGILAFAFGISAVVIYCSKIPESLYSGRYDYLIGSHAIFHVLSASCLWITMYNCMALQERRFEIGEICPKY